MCVCVCVCVCERGAPHPEPAFALSGGAPTRQSLNPNGGRPAHLTRTPTRPSRTARARASARSSL